MEPAREFTLPPGGGVLPYAVDRPDTWTRRPDAVILQVDATVSGLDGLAWLIGRRDNEMVNRLAAVQREASADGWSWAELTRARLLHLRPRRAEINELGAAYLAALTPGAADAVKSFRRSGIQISLASDVAAEALFGVATALGVSPDELYAPRLRFDAIGAYAGCDLAVGRADDDGDASARRGFVIAPRTLFVGTRRSAMFAPRDTDLFVAFSGVVAREGRTDAAASVSSFHDLAERVLR